MAAILESFRVKAHIKASLKINLTHVFDFLMITDWMSDSLTADAVQLMSSYYLTQVLYLCLFDLNVMAEAGKRKNTFISPVIDVLLIRLQLI